MVEPSSEEASSASRSAGLVAATCLTKRSASAMKASFLATKSVSQFSSRSALSAWATRPLAVARPARLPTSLAPLMRRNSTALSKSPSDSSSAFLQSIIPAAVRSRSRLTSAAVKLAMLVSSCPFLFGRSGLGSGRGGGRGPAGGGSEQLLLPLGQRLVRGNGSRLRLDVATTGGLARAGDQAVGHCRGDDLGEQLGGADRVVVARDREVDLVRVTVRVEDR